MRKYSLVIVSGLAMTFLPLAASAQTTAPSDAPSAHDMKGPPNASGYGKDKGIDKTSPVIGSAGVHMKGDETAPSAKDMKGPPNTNGFSK